MICHYPNNTSLPKSTAHGLVEQKSRFHDQLSWAMTEQSLNNSIARIRNQTTYKLVKVTKIFSLPSSGGSQNRSIALISESFTPSTLKRPPWTINFFSFITWAKGKQQNTSAKSSTNVSFNLDLTSPSKPYILFMLLLSWFPRARCIAENSRKLFDSLEYLIWFPKQFRQTSTPTRCRT